MAAAKAHSWSNESLTKAVEEVQDKKLSLRAASAMYGIPRSTIHNYITGKTKIGAAKGPATVLTKEEEQQLVEWALKMAEIGYGQTRRQVCEMVKRIMDRTKRPNPFTDNRPGKDWWYAFLRRHPQVVMRQPQALQAAHALSCTPQILDRWFAEFEQFLLQHDLLDKPFRIWNCDESGFPLCPKSGKVLALQGARNVYHLTGNSKEQITTLCCISAAGGIIPPMHVFPGERFSYNPLEGGVEGSYFGKSTNGWMTQELFFGWITRHYAIHLPPGRPVCLLVDGHSSHIDLDVSNSCQANQILLYCLPPHTSHVLQPLDVGLFSPMKHSWRVAATEYQQNEGKPIDKRSFARVFRSAYQKVVKLSSLVNAFKASGIYPVNRQAIDQKKLQPSQVYSSEPSSSSCEASSSFKPSVGASKLALKALEEELDQQTISCFTRRFEEGYDLTDDFTYITWAKLKKASQPLANISNTKDSHSSVSAPTQSSTTVPSILNATDKIVEDVLKLPKRQQAKKQTQRGTAHLPKHLSGEEMVKLLDERRMKKIREAQEKEERKAAREARKRKREEEKQQRAAQKMKKIKEAQEKEEKKAVREAKKRKREEEKQQKAAAQKRAKKTQTLTQQKSSIQSQHQQHTSSDITTVFPVCNEVYKDGEDSLIWIECIRCEEWLHLQCTRIPPRQHAKLDQLDFICHLCN